jgi:AhpD family alkylhydroperoxidase
MTTTTATAIPVRLDFDAHAQTFSRAMAHLDNAATKELDRVDIDHRLREVLRLRVSQMNGCAYCVDMHFKNARAVGETEQRLAALPVWRETPFFTDAERAALAFAEAMVAMADSHVPAAAFDGVAQHYGPDEIAALVALVVTVAAWNGIGVSTRAWQPGSYEP